MSLSLKMVIVAAVAFAVPLNAATLYTTLGPGGSVSILRYGIDGNTGYGGFYFQPVISGALDTLTVAVSHQSPPAQTIFRLYSGPVASATLLETFVIASGSQIETLVTANSTVHPFLNAGGLYWLAFTEPAAPDGNNSRWAMNNRGIFGTRILSGVESAVLGTMPAFQLDSSPVPEPSTILLVSAAALILAVRQRIASQPRPSR